MAEDQVGMRKDVLQQLAPWTKLFSAFKVALDPKKLLLAGAGILVMQLGWWVLAMVYFGFGSDKPPDWACSARRCASRWRLLRRLSRTGGRRRDQ